MECKGCGAQINSGEVCSYCGTKPEEVAGNREINVFYSGAKPIIKASKSKTKINKKPMAWLSIIIIVVLIICTSIANKQTNVRHYNKETNNNSYNYSKPQFIPKKGNVSDITQMYPSGEMTELLIKSNLEKGVQMYKYEDTFYFLSDKLFVTTNFTDITTYDISGYKNIYVDDMYIYYQTQNDYYRINKTNLNAGIMDPELVVSNVGYAIISNGVIYYTDSNGYLYKYNMETDENNILRDYPITRSFFHLDQSNNYLYYSINGSILERLSLDSGAQQVYSNISCSDFIIDGDLVYVNHGKTWDIYSLENNAHVKKVEIDSNTISWSNRIADGFIYVDLYKTFWLLRDSGEKIRLFEFDRQTQVSTIQLYGDKILIRLWCDNNYYWYIADYYGNFSLFNTELNV